MEKVEAILSGVQAEIEQEYGEWNCRLCTFITKVK